MANRRAVTGLLLAVTACGGAGHQEEPTPATAPLPILALAGQEIAVLPLRRVSADTAARWREHMSSRAAVLAEADSLIAVYLSAEAPEITWILPPRLRAVARRNPTVAPDPDKLPSSIMRAPSLRQLPDPLRSDLRRLVGLAGGRLVLIPANLRYTAVADGQGQAELTVVLADVRTGRVTYRTVATGQGSSAAASLARALSSLTAATP